LVVAAIRFATLPFGNCRARITGGEEGRKIFLMRFFVPDLLIFLSPVDPHLAKIRMLLMAACRRGSRSSLDDRNAHAGS